MSAPDQRGRKLDNNEEGLKGGLFVVTFFFGGGGGPLAAGPEKAAGQREATV